MFKRAGTKFYALMVLTLAGVAVVDVAINDQLTLIHPYLLAAFALIGIGFLLFSLLETRGRAVDLEGRTDRLSALTGELEAFITALEAANKRLHASEARYKGLVDAQGDAILRRTADGRMTYANEACFRFFGVKADEVIGTVFRPEPHPDSPAPVFGRFAGRELGRERVSYDQHVKTVAGFRWIAWEDYAIRDTDGRLVEIQSVGRDVTERKMLEAALTEARDRAQEANRAKSHFLATISHEIRTPMNGVLGMARLLQETGLAPDQRSYAEAIRQSGLSLLALIEDLLDFSKIESGNLVVENGDVALRPLVEGVSELLSTRAHSKGIDIVTTISADVPDVIQADAIRLRQVLTNLVGNAIKFTEEGGILISAKVEKSSRGPELLLSVRDTGIGVPEEKRVTIFEDFVQADSSHARRFEGTGLGLAISKRLVGAMGGSIGVMNAEDRGSVFWVRLPLHSDLAQPRKGELAGKHVAIVSASDILRAGLKLQLMVTGADVFECADLETVRSRTPKFDLLILDAAMSEADPLPNVTGLGIPTVALVPPQYRTTLSGLRDKGIRGYLTKPVRQASLETRLTAVLKGETALEPAFVPVSAERRSGPGALTVLLAEDNPVNALLARELLRRRGHAVHEVTTGEAAVDACSRNRFDLVLMDLHMPGLDGIQATQRIRASEKENSARPMPIYALTADALETGRKACLEAGMDGFLTKPVDPAELDSILGTVGSITAAAAAA